MRTRAEKLDTLHQRIDDLDEVACDLAKSSKQQARVDTASQAVSDALEELMKEFPPVEKPLTVADLPGVGSRQHVVVSITNIVLTYGPFDSREGAETFITKYAVVNAVVSEMMKVPHVQCSLNPWCERQDQHDWICRAEGEV